MAEDFREITDDLFSKIGADDLAEKLECSVQSVRQARLDRGLPSYRSPPDGWKKAAKAMALTRAAFFTNLAKRLS